ncbi:MAG TPA: protein kinase [Ktedonobacterales bacterium]|jgi:D-alanyl-D-alanine carboxypeptidase
MSSSPLYCPICGAANAPDATTCFACGSALDPTSSPPRNPAGSTISGSITAPLPAVHLLRGRYRLLGRVGQGGMGTVYRAEDTQLGNRLVAVKEMSARGLSPEEVQELTEGFQREALLLAQLTHPNLPRIYEQFSEGDHWYLVMDFIEGETLEERLAKTPGGRLPMPEVMQLGIQLAAVLGYLHTRQPPIIFRDLKPANIMLTSDGHLYLIDFGIARFFKPGQTKDTAPFGSSGYAAPEQYGKAQTTPQADIYSLGATLHHLLSGTDPSQTPFVFAPLHLDGPDGLETLIVQMVQTDRANRPASIEIVKQELQRLATLPERAVSAALSTGTSAPASRAASARPGLSLRAPLKRRLSRPSLQGIIVAAALVCLVALIPLTIPVLSSVFSQGASAVAALEPSPTPTPTDTPIPTPSPTPSPTPVPFANGAEEYLVDAGTGSALYSKGNIHTHLPIASLAKIMTALLAIEQGGDLANNVAPITQEELDEVPDGCYTAGLVVGDDNMSILHLLYGLLLPSGCDAAIVIAHAIAGTTKQFVAEMNARARTLGLSNTHFTSPDGFEPTNYSSVADLVKLAEYAMKNPTFAQIVATTQHVVPAQTNRHLYTWPNSNQLLSTGLYPYPGANGIKTGTSDEAGYCLVFSAVRNGRLLIGAELDAPTSDLLYGDATRMLNLGFSR